MATPTTATRSSKRKRIQVSYLADDYFDSLDMDGNVAAGPDHDSEPIDNDQDKDEVEGDEVPEDGEFFHKGKGKAPPKKKAKRIAAPKKPKVKKPFRFMDLPAELRDDIYDICLTEPDGITLVSKRKGSRKTVGRGVITTETGKSYHGKRRKAGSRYGYWSYRHNDRGEVESTGVPTRKFSPNLIAVNKQIREEASSVLYRQDIVLEDTTALLHFLATIGDYNRQMLTELTVAGWGQGQGKADANNIAAFAMLSVCKNIQTVFLDCAFYCYTSPANLASIVYCAAHFFLDAIGSARGDNEAALDVIQLSDWNFDKTLVPSPPGQIGTSSENTDKYKPADEVEEEFRKELRDLLRVRGEGRHRRRRYY